LSIVVVHGDGFERPFPPRLRKYADWGFDLSVQGGRGASCGLVQCAGHWARTAGVIHGRRATRSWRGGANRRWRESRAAARRRVRTPPDLSCACLSSNDRNPRSRRLYQTCREEFSLVSPSAPRGGKRVRGPLSATSRSDMPRRAAPGRSPYAAAGSPPWLACSETRRVGAAF
jgi:hypothetical protein